MDGWNGGGEKISCSGGKRRKEEWKANPDFGMERSGCSTSLDQSPTGEFPWIRTERQPDGVKNDERGWKEEVERAGEKELDGTSSTKDDGIGELDGLEDWCDEIAVPQTDTANGKKQTSSRREIELVEVDNSRKQ